MPRSAPGVTRKPMIESQGDTRQTQCAWCLRDHLETNRSLRFAARLRHAGAAVARLPAHGAVARGGRLRLPAGGGVPGVRSEEHTSELQSLMRISYAVFCLKKTNKQQQ